MLYNVSVKSLVCIFRFGVDYGELTSCIVHFCVQYALWSVQLYRVHIYALHIVSCALYIVHIVVNLVHIGVRVHGKQGWKRGEAGAQSLPDNKAANYMATSPTCPA